MIKTLFTKFFILEQHYKNYATTITILLRKPNYFRSSSIIPNYIRNVSLHSTLLCATISNTSIH